MRQRDLLALLGSAAASWLPARAQQPTPVIGFLGISPPSKFAPLMAAFRQGLSETGYVDGQNLAIEHHWVESHYDRLAALAADFVQRKLDLIATPDVQNGARVAIQRPETACHPLTTRGAVLYNGLRVVADRVGRRLTGIGGA
jgi:putative ABC transport system substrate-binding protein